MGVNPHTPLYAAKTKILAQVKQFLAAPMPKQEISTVAISLQENLNLWELLPFIDAQQKVFFGEREGHKQYLGIHFLRTFGGAFALEQVRPLLTQNSQLVVLGGQRFHPNQPPAPEWSDLGAHHYVLPQFLFVIENNQTQLRINVTSDAFLRKSEGMRLLMAIEALFSFKGHAQSQLKFTEKSEIPNFTQWSQLVAKAKQSFSNDELDKVVLARKCILKSPVGLRPDAILAQLKVASNEHFIFHLQWRADRAFTSLTPERLFQLQGQRLITDSLAATRPRGKDAAKDAALAHELLTSPKELEEHRHVTRGILSTMESLGIKNAAVTGNAESVMKLTHVQHLHTRLGGDLARATPLRELLDAFHPTAAVGGAPKMLAREWLEENECYDRGFYAAPLGVVQHKRADFCVAIRSALVFGRELHIYAGAGIVAQSDANAEWIETTNKMKNFPFQVAASEAAAQENEYEQPPLM